MVSQSSIFSGVVRGDTIKLDSTTGLPDGERVMVVVQAAGTTANPPTTAGDLGRAFGGWAEEAAAVDEFLEQNRRQRRHPRRELLP